MAFTPDNSQIIDKIYHPEDHHFINGPLARYKEVRYALIEIVHRNWEGENDPALAKASLLVLDVQDSHVKETEELKAKVITLEEKVTSLEAQVAKDRELKRTMQEVLIAIAGSSKLKGVVSAGQIDALISEIVTDDETSTVKVKTRTAPHTGSSQDKD